MILPNLIHSKSNKHPVKEDNFWEVFDALVEGSVPTQGFDIHFEFLIVFFANLSHIILHNEPIKFDFPGISILATSHEEVFWPIQVITSRFDGSDE